MATSTVEDYLKSILLAEQDGPDGLVTMGEIAGRLGVAPGTVTAMVKTLADSGLVDYEPYSGVRLTAAGRQLASHVLRRHRLVELFLVRIMGMSWSEVHSEAERLEHAVSEELVERMDRMLGHPSVDPHGDPIPDSEGVVEQRRLSSLLSCPHGTEVVVERITDQSASFLDLVEEQGFMPGSVVSVRERNEAADRVTLELADGGRVDLGYRAAGKVLVSAPSVGR